MHTTELLGLFDKWACGGREDPIVQIVKELITRSSLQTAAIVAMDGPDGDDVSAKVKALVAHVAHVAPKKKYAADDIVLKVDGGNLSHVRCGGYEWASFGWKKEVGLDSWPIKTAEAIAAGLRATNNLPEEYK